MFLSRLLPFLIALGTASASFGNIDRTLDRWGDQIDVQSESGWLFIDNELQLDVSVYGSDNRGSPPGFFFPDTDDTWGWAPRFEWAMTAFLGDRITVFSKLRWDYGVHPGSARIDGDYVQVRFDELYLSARLWENYLSVKAGQFTPQIGGFLGRQHNWDHGLISYPLLYENVLSVGDFPVPPNTRAFANRATEAELKALWVPVIWAPLYTRGVALEGTLEQFSYSVNFLNAQVSSRGSAWNDNDWSEPTLAGRLGWMPDASWDLGISVAHGAYFRNNTPTALFPGDSDRGDFTQTNVGLDARWARRDLQVWAELWWARFETPNVPDAPEVFSGFVEAQYDVTPRLWVSGRLNLETYNQLHDPASGAALDWDNPILRLDTGVGYRLLRHLQLKGQYSYQYHDADFQNANHFLATEVSLRL